MPGQASLDAQEYYANRQNAFWRIMGHLFGAGPEVPYVQRLEKLQAAGVALWDVIASCEREGSLDADIVGATVCVNDFSQLFIEHPAIGHVFFNGAAAETAFRRYALPGLAGRHLQLCRLPSTSPANAACRYEEKLAAWSVLITASNKSLPGSV